MPRKWLSLKPSLPDSWRVPRTALLGVGDRRVRAGPQCSGEGRGAVTASIGGLLTSEDGGAVPSAGDWLTSLKSWGWGSRPSS